MAILLPQALKCSDSKSELQEVGKNFLKMRNPCVAGVGRLKDCGGEGGRRGEDGPAGEGACCQPDDLCSVPRTHRVGGESAWWKERQPQEVVLGFHKHT